jgi:hypothetical protein
VRSLVVIALCIGCSGTVDPKAVMVLSWLRAAPRIVQCVIAEAPTPTVMDAATAVDASVDSAEVYMPRSI